MNSQQLEQFYRERSYTKVFAYPLWTIYLEPKQYYLGWVFAWANRPDCYDVTLTTPEEWQELHQIIQDTKTVFASFLRPELVNVSFLGNMSRHCHCHIIPRYKEPVSFDGDLFADENFGQHYNQTNTQYRETLHPIRFEKLRSHLADAFQRLTYVS